MLLPRRLLILLPLIFLFVITQAQTTKTFSLFSPADQGTVLLQGNKTDLFPFVWTNGKGPQTTNVNYDYALIFYANGDTNSPIENITKTCCASSFADTVLNFSGEQWDGFLNGISNQLKGRDFLYGDTIDLLWRVNLSAVSPGPSYEFRPSNADFSVRFIRGQFSDEYVPVFHKSPANFQQVNVAGNPNQQVSFSWTAAYCPGGCATASYDLLIDTIDGDFEYPYLTYSIPNNDSSWNVSYSVLNVLLNDTKTPHGKTHKVYWKVLITGNNQVVYSMNKGELTLFNGLLDNENFPFNLIAPATNSIVHLNGLPNTPLSFSWQSTYTPGGSPNLYFVVFDTAGASTIFGNPLMQFVSAAGGSDTTLNLSYSQLDAGLDSLYPGWTQANMIWGIKAQINGTYYYAIEPHSIEFKAGVLNSISSAPRKALHSYPNPANDQLFIAAADHTREIFIYSLQGQLVYTLSLMAGETKIPCSALADGLYFLYVQDKESLFSEKIMISH